MATAEPIVQAIKDGDAAAARALVQQDPSFAAARDENGISVVMLAAYYRQSEVLSVLLAANPPLDLFEAAALGKRELLDEMIDENPSSVADRSPDGFTPLHLACFFGHLLCTQLLIQKGADVNAGAENPMAVRPLHSAAAGHHLDVVKLLLEKGADADVQQQGGFTALHAAAMQGDEAMVQALIEAKADPHLQADDGKTAVEMAREKGHESLASLLS